MQICTDLQGVLNMGSSCPVYGSKKQKYCKSSKTLFRGSFQFHCAEKKPNGGPFCEVRITSKKVAKCRKIQRGNETYITLACHHYPFSLSSEKVQLLEGVCECESQNGAKNFCFSPMGRPVFLALEEGS